jgi:Ni,Fe-hydrogenase III small subunit
VLELNRLVLVNNKPNEASRLVAASFKLLPTPRIIVSFADTAQNHQGIVYQATNFIYTGLSAKFRDPRVKGLEHQHHATYGHGLSNQQIIEKYGAENVYFVERSRKHRYITFVGNRTEKKMMRSALLYKQLPYPKGTQ